MERLVWSRAALTLASLKLATSLSPFPQELYRHQQYPQRQPSVEACFNCVKGAPISNIPIVILTADSGNMQGPSCRIAAHIIAHVKLASDNRCCALPLVWAVAQEETFEDNNQPTERKMTQGLETLLTAKP